MNVFGYKKDDIYVVSFPKSGTTLCQVILYEMVNNGQNEFEHINDVSPWIRNEVFKNNPIKEIPGRRIIKSHDYYKLFPRAFNGRIIFVYRDGRDVALSLFHQKKNYNNPSLSFEKHFAEMFGKGPMNWFRFNKLWFENKRNYNILYVSYNEMVNNKLKVINKLADFLKIDLNTFDTNIVLNKSSFEYMKANEQKFGEKPEKKTERVYNQFIRNGLIGEGKEILTSDQAEFFEAQMKLELNQMLKMKLQHV